MNTTAMKLCTFRITVLLLTYLDYTQIFLTLLYFKHDLVRIPLILKRFFVSGAYIPKL